MKSQISKTYHFFFIFFLFSFYAQFANAQQIGLCDGINYISKSLNKKDALEDLKNYGEEKMGFSSSYGDHPFRKAGSYFQTDENRGRYTLKAYPANEADAKKLYNTYYEQLKGCYGDLKEDTNSSVGQSASFENKGTHIDLMLLTLSNIYDSKKMDYSIYVRFYKMKD